MKTLTLLRHAKSDWSNAGLHDHDRPLSARGRSEIPTIAKCIRGANIRPSLIVTSSAIRARETARILAAELGFPAEFIQQEKSAYLATAEQLKKMIAVQDDGFNSIIIVGHNPGLSDLAQELLPCSAESLPTCGVFAMELDTDSWGLLDGAKAKMLLKKKPDLPINNNGN